MDSWLIPMMLMMQNQNHQPTVVQQPATDTKPRIIVLDASSAGQSPVVASRGKRSVRLVEPLQGMLSQEESSSYRVVSHPSGAKIILPPAPTQAQAYPPESSYQEEPGLIGYLSKAVEWNDRIDSSKTKLKFMKYMLGMTDKKDDSWNWFGRK